MELQDATEDFLACKRKSGQGATEFKSYFRTTLNQLERVLTDQMNQDTKDEHQCKIHEYHVTWDRYCHETAIYDRRLGAVSYTHLTLPTICSV
eukprot:8567565-Alexandrium_andersonii.AAC.1